MDQVEQPRGVRQRRWNQVSWWYSLILPVALFLLIISMIVDRVGADPAVSGVVTDAYTGKPVQGVRVAVGGTAVETDGKGQFSFATPVSGSLSVSREDYESTQVPVAATDSEVEIRIRPTTLTGTVTNERTGEPLVGATVSVSSPGQASVKTITDEQGRYLLIDVPADAVVTVSHDGLSPVSMQVDHHVVLDFEVRLDILTGRIVDAAGQPIAEASIQVGDAIATSAADGTFRLVDAPADGDVVVKKAGFRVVNGEYPESMRFDVTLEALEVKAIYATAEAAGDDATWRSILDLIESTELNAIVLDVKDESGYVRYDTGVALAGETGARSPAYNLSSRLRDLKDRDIYAIARLVVFEDPVLAAGRPDLAIKDVNDASPWTTWDGNAWVNPMDASVWQYNIEVAAEVAGAGFDEIQLDYVRFPTDGLIELADYGAPFTTETRTAAIREFLTLMRTTLAPTGVFLAIEVSGIVLWDESDNGIGQDLDEIAPLVDVVSPVVHPSHFPPGTFGYDFPNDHPFQVIKVNLERITQRFGGSADKFRPWLQDYSSGLGIDYSDEQVRAQIDAAEQHGSTGWMLWNPANDYSTGALAPE